MRLVIDSSAVLAIVLNEPHRPNLLKITSGAEIVAPMTLEWEIGNALSPMFKRQGITELDALAAIKLYRVMPIRPIHVSLEESVRLTAALKIYAYDAYMIRCAQETGSPLVTLDKGLRHAAIKIRVSVL